MAEIVIDNRANLIVADMLAALVGATVGGVPIFANAICVNDVESFIRVADPLTAESRPICGIVEGSIERRHGANSDEESACRLPFEIIVRFMFRREPGKGEQGALELGKRYAQFVVAALMLDPGRNGKANLVQWNAEPVNGTTLNGNIRPVIRATNEAFFAVSISGAVCWINFRE